MRVKCVIMCKFSRSNLNYTGKSCHVLIVSYKPCALNTSVHLCCELCVGIVIFFSKAFNGHKACPSGKYKLEGTSFNSLPLLCRHQLASLHIIGHFLKGAHNI